MTSISPFNVAAAQGEEVEDVTFPSFSIWSLNKFELRYVRIWKNVLRMCSSDQIVKHQFADLTRTTLSEFSRHRGWSVSLENGFQIFTPLVVSIKVIKAGPKGRTELKRYFVYFFILSPRHGFVKITHKLLETGISTLDM